MENMDNKYTNEDIIRLLDKCAGLISKGCVEGAYKGIVAGPEYPEKVFKEIYDEAIPLLLKGAINQ